MRELLVFETELDQIGLLNTLTSGFFSAASGCFLFVVGLVTNWAMVETLPPKGVALIQFGGAVGLLFTVGFLVFGYLAWRKRQSLIDTIKSQAVDIEQTPQIPIGAVSQLASDTGEPQTRGGV